MPLLDPKGAAAFCALVLDSVAPAKAVHRAALAAHNFSRDLLDALDACDRARGRAAQHFPRDRKDPP